MRARKRRPERSTGRADREERAGRRVSGQSAGQDNPNPSDPPQRPGQFQTQRQEATNRSEEPQKPSSHGLDDSATKTPRRYRYQSGATAPASPSHAHTHDPLIRYDMDQAQHTPSRSS